MFNPLKVYFSGQNNLSLFKPASHWVGSGLGGDRLSLDSLRTGQLATGFIDGI